MERQLMASSRPSHCSRAQVGIIRDLPLCSKVYSFPAVSPERWSGSDAPPTIDLLAAIPTTARYSAHTASRWAALTQLDPNQWFVMATVEETLTSSKQTPRNIPLELKQQQEKKLFSRPSPVTPRCVLAEEEAKKTHMQTVSGSVHGQD